MKKNRAFLLSFVLALGAGAAALAFPDGQPLPWCIEAKWFNSTITCDGGCGVSYVVCPGSILCARSTVNLNASALYPAFATCRSFIGGSGTCPGCTGGTEVIPPGVTTTAPITMQNCTEPCGSGGGGH